MKGWVKPIFMARLMVGVMSAARMSAFLESSAGIRPSQSKSRNVTLTPMSLASISHSSIELPARLPFLSMKLNGGPWVWHATRSSPRWAISSRVPARLIVANPTTITNAINHLTRFMIRSSLPLGLVVVLFHLFRDDDSPLGQSRHERGIGNMQRGVENAFCW